MTQDEKKIVTQSQRIRLFILNKYTYSEMTQALSRIPELYSRRINSPIITALKYLTEH